MNLYKGARLKAEDGMHLSEEFEVSVGVHQGSVLSPQMSAIVIDVDPSKIKEGMLEEILQANDIFLISKAMAELCWKKIL